MARELSGFISVFQVCSAPHVCSWVWAGQGAGACSGIGAKSQKSHICSHPSSGDSRKSHRSPLTPCSCTFTVLVLPLPGCSSNTNATLSPDFWLLCQRQLCSEPGLCRAALQGSSHTSFMRNLNVFRAYLSEPELSTGREGITLSGEGT